ncbi:MAG: (2Fe-2S)-binding protein [Parachlamydiaceae bacterium]|nr:(2Fe-2S)-binding protein [Parachlamydiaceae bacterium]
MGAKILFVKESLVKEVPIGADFQRIHALYPELPLRFGCRNGECGVCILFIEKGMENLTKRTPDEVKTFARKGFPVNCRLACQCAINGDIIVGIFPPSQISSESSPNSPESPSSS